MHPDIYAENAELDAKEEQPETMGLLPKTTVTHKYHIYELKEGQWEIFRCPEWTKLSAVQYFEYIRKWCPHLTFKLITEKITTTSEFIEDSNEPT